MLTTHAGARGTKVRFFFALSVCIFRVYRMEQSNVRRIFLECSIKEKEQNVNAIDCHNIKIQNYKLLLSK